MSPGIVRFYFESKAAMLVASLQFLAAEFEEQVLVPVSKLKSKPVAALEMMVDLYLDPEIASPRKVSVWYAFWGEASSRQEYYDICGQKDESFAALVRELIGRLIEETHQPHLDPGRNRARPHRGAGNAVAGLCLSKRGQHRPAGREAPLHGLSALDLPRTVPIVCARKGGCAAAAGAVNRFPGWAYCNSFAFTMERDRLFQGAAQIAGHESQIPRAGDYLAADIGAERALLVRDSAGRIHALRNSCPQQPHALVSDGGGRFEGGTIDCKVHGLKFTLDGRRADAGGRFDLSALELQASGGLLFVRSPQTARSSSLAPATGSSTTLHGLLPLGPAAQVCVAADWKVLIEQWLETVALDGTPAPAADSIAWTFRPGTGAPTWSSQALSFPGGLGRQRRMAGALHRAESIAAIAPRRGVDPAGSADRPGALPPAAARLHLVCGRCKRARAAICGLAAEAAGAPQRARGRRIRTDGNGRFRLSSRRPWPGSAGARLVSARAADTRSRACARSAADRFLDEFTILRHRVTIYRENCA